jgi:hypothetical protein
MTKKKIEEWIPDLIRNNKEKERMDFYVRRNDGYFGFPVKLRMTRKRK